MTLIFGILLLTLLVITALAIVHTDNLFVAVMLTGIFSLMLAANFFVLDAPDVALTEAAIGAGVSTVLFLGALALTAASERKGPVNRLALPVVIATMLILIYTSFFGPIFSDPEAPVHSHVAPWYLENTPILIDVPNAVTAVLGSFRGYDTFGEVFVVFTAGIGVLFLLSARPTRVKDPRVSKMAPNHGLKHYLIPRLVGRLLIPFILLFGLYVQFHGDYGPGGGFQAGALVAASIILYGLLEGEKNALQILPKRLLMFMVTGGALLYGFTGIFGILLGGTFLDYSVLASNPVSGQHIGILLIEAGVGITVTGVLLSIYHAFAARGKF